MQGTATNHFVAGADPSGVGLDEGAEEGARGGGRNDSGDGGVVGGQTGGEDGGGGRGGESADSTAHYLTTNGLGVGQGSSASDLESLTAAQSAAAALYVAHHNAAVQQLQQNAANGGDPMMSGLSEEDEMSRAAAVAAAAAVMQQQGYSSAEALQYAYQTASDGGSVIQYPFGMGLGSLQLAQMGSLLQAGQQYALLSGAEDAVYVNQKQFHRILKRRQARMKLEAKFKIMPRKEWLHDSRHKHAKNRQRGPGGRFLSKAERDKLGSTPALYFFTVLAVFTHVCVRYEVDDDYDGEGYGDEGGSSSPPNPTSPAPSNFVG